MTLNVITRKSSWLIKGTKRKPANYLLAALITIVMLSVPSFAQSTAITNGLNWLSSNQNMDGSFGNVVPARDTPEVAVTLKYLNPTGPNYQNAINWINSNIPSNNDYLARKINSLALSGGDVSSLLTSLDSSQNADGGWGLSSNHTVGELLTTALSLLTLKAANYTDQTVINNAITYLLNNQNTDGGWAFRQAQGDETYDSNVYMTALVSWTLQQFPQTTSIATAVNKATSYLIAHQNADGGFGSSPSTVYETALAFEALISSGQASLPLQNAINYLTTTQLADGSWNDDPYSTALALRALANVKPNLVISSSDITFSNAMPTIGDTITITATIKNTGPANAENILVQFYDGDPSAGGSLISETALLSIPSYSDASIVISYAAQTASSHKIYVKTDPLNAIDEIIELQFQEYPERTYRTTYRKMIDRFKPLVYI